MSRQSEKVAHVGWTKSYEDFERLVLFIQHTRSMGLSDYTDLKPVFFDLSKGKDFLKDTGKYKAVVLHFVFRGGFSVNQDIQVRSSPLRISPLSSWGQWRRRLTDTGADVIVAFGGGSEVNGSFLVDIPGYGKIKKEFLYEYRVGIPTFGQPTASIFIKEGLDRI